MAIPCTFDGAQLNCHESGWAYSFFLTRASQELLAAEQLASSASKKKTKKKTSTAEASEPALTPDTRPRNGCIELQSMLKRLHDQINIPTVPNIFGTDLILPSLNSVLQLTSLPDPQPALLLSVTIRTIEAIANTLKTIILRSTPNVPSEVHTLKMLNIFLHHMFDVVIPRLVPSPDISPQATPLGPTTPDIAVEGLIDTLLEKTSALILNPLIHAFTPLSQTYLNAILIPSAAGSATNATTVNSAGSAKPPGHKSGKIAATSDLPTDVRGDALSLFSVVFRALNTQLQNRVPLLPNLHLSLHTLRASLILESIREFERTSSSVPVNYLPSVPGGNTDDPDCVGSTSRDIDMGKSTMRVKRLAMKDARWYMCTILHTVLSETSETPSIACTSLTVSITPGNAEARINEVEARRDAQAGGGHLLDKVISDALYGLVTRCKQTASSSRHDETRIGEFNGIRDDEILGESASSMGKEKQESHAQRQGRVGDRMIPPNTSRSGKPEVQSAIGDSGLDVDADTGSAFDVGVNAGGQLATQSGRVQDAESVPLGSTTSNSPGVIRDDEMIDLDEIEHGMLLAVIERYWVWSESQKC